MSVKKPRVFVVTDTRTAFWVQGLDESADPRNWMLYSGVLDEFNEVDMSTALAAKDIEDWAGTNWEGRNPSVREMFTLTVLIGNTIRMMNGFDPVPSAWLA